MDAANGYVIVQKADAIRLARFGLNNAGNGLRSDVKLSAMRVLAIASASQDASPREASQKPAMDARPTNDMSARAAIAKAAALQTPSVFESIFRQITELPLAGTPAAELTDRDKVALGIAAGVPYDTGMRDGKLKVTLLKKIGVADRGDGTWIIGIEK